MTYDMVLKRGRRAGNVLLANVLINLGFSALEILGNGDRSNFIIFVIGGVISLAVTSILIDPLKKDRIKDIRTIYILLACLNVGLLYLTLKDGSSVDATNDILQIAIYGLVIISLYSLGKTGRNFCYLAALLSVITIGFISTESESFFNDFLDSSFSAIYYVFLGLYVEAKGIFSEMEDTIEDEPTRASSRQSNYYRNDYDELIKLKELMEDGVITPAEYEEKKKQILGL